LTATTQPAGATQATLPSSPRAPGKSWLVDFILLGATWGTSFMFTRLAVVDFGALPSAGMRVLIGAVVLLLILGAKGQLPVLGAHWRKTFFVGLLNSAIPFACFAWALLTITTGLSSIMNATVPLFGALVAWVWLKDRPGGSRLLGLAIGFVGVVLLAWDKSGLGAAHPAVSAGVGTGDGAGNGLQLLSLLLACLCYGIAASFTKVYLNQVPPLITAAGSQCGATLALLLPMLWLWPAKNPGLTAWVAIIISGVVCTGLAYVLYFRLISRIGPAKAMTVTFLIPVFAVISGVAFLGESVTLWMLGCGVVIVCGTALSTGLVALPFRR
jgi:drug/metabolite transporter (DMT)-like permease